MFTTVKMKIHIIIGICTYLTTVASEPPRPQGFDHHMTLVPDQYFLYWTVSGDEIKFQVQVNTLGYVGFGISPNGGMAGSDIVMAWVKGDQVFLQDRYATKNDQPKIDLEQNWSLIEGMEKDGYTIITFKRKLISCDKDNDRDITGETMRIIYAYHPEDPKDASATFYHGAKRRGSKSVTLLLYGVRKDITQLPPHTDYQDFRLPIFEIPVNSTTYWCRAFEMPQLEGKHHIVRFEPLIRKENEGVVHHIVLYSCRHKFNETAHRGKHGECFSNLMGEVDKCSGFIFAWAIGATAFNFPDHTGYPIGDGGFTMVKMEIHYDNPQSKSGIMDDSGIRMYYTDNLREFDSGYLEIGAMLEGLMIPPKYEKLTSSSHCSPACLSKAIPTADEIKVSAIFLHAHLMGTKIRVRHFRDGKELPFLAKDDFYDFNYQDVRILPKEVSVKPTDHLMVECDYRSINRKNATFGGFGTQEEMCFAFLSYYPQRTLSRCVSAPVPSQNAKAMNLTLKFENDKEIDNGALNKFNITGPAKFAYKSFKEVMNMIDWNDAAARQHFEKTMMEDGVHVIQMCDDGTEVELMKISPVKLPKIQETYEVPPQICTAHRNNVGFMVQASTVVTMTVLFIGIAF